MDGNLRCCHGSAFAWLKLLGFCEKWSVFHSKGIDIVLFVEIRNQRSKLVPVPNFSQIGQKIREVEFRPESCLMTSYLARDDDVSNIVMGLEIFCCKAFLQAIAEYYLATCGDIGSQIREKQGGTHSTPQRIFYQNTTP